MTPKWHGVSIGVSVARCSRSALEDAVLGWIIELLGLLSLVTPHCAEEGTKSLLFSPFTQVVLQTRLTSGALRRRNP